jgi:hypothetical protein
VGNAESEQTVLDPQGLQFSDEILGLSEVLQGPTVHFVHDFSFLGVYYKACKFCAFSALRMAPVTPLVNFCNISNTGYTKNIRKVGSDESPVSEALTTSATNYDSSAVS